MCGRGDEFEQSLPPLAAHIVVVKPAASVPTAAAYRAFDSAPQPAGAVAAVADALRCKDVAALAAALGNNMTAASEALVPEIGGIRRWLGGQDGVLGMLMAGSGSAVFAVCEDETGANRAADAARARGWWSVATRTRAHGVTMVEGEGPA
jgi:4-diphosphocytidyl-2-C-methyl-D-erythritol kinase